MPQDENGNYYEEGQTGTGGGGPVPPAFGGGMQYGYPSGVRPAMQPGQAVDPRQTKAGQFGLNPFMQNTPGQS